MSIRAQTVPTANSTRMNLEVIEDAGEVTEILEPGQPVTPEEIEQMRIAYQSVLKESAGHGIAIVSGSLPRGVAPDFYATLVELAHKCGCRVFLDTSGEPLRLALKSHPDFVKSNQEEAEELSGKLIHGPHRAANALKEFLHEGACSTAISLGKTGLVWQPAAEREVLFAKGLELNVRSTVGSGDATLAGFAFAAQAAAQPKDALRLAAACGAANCLADAPGRARAADILKLQNEIHVEVLS
jgi:1-phosphofructokinase family hexose kinase